MSLKSKSELPKVFATRRTQADLERDKTNQFDPTISLDGPGDQSPTRAPRSQPIPTITSSPIPLRAANPPGHQPHDVSIFALSALLPAAEAIPIAGPPMKAAIGGLLLILKTIDQISKNKEDIQALISKLRHLDNHINAIPAVGPPLNRPRDSLTRQLNETTNALKIIGGRSKFQYSSVTQAIDQCSKDVDRYLLQCSVLSNMQLENYAHTNDRRMERVAGRIESLHGDVQAMISLLQTFTGTQQTFNAVSVGFIHLMDATGQRHPVPMTMATSFEQFVDVMRSLFRPETFQGRILRRYMDSGAYDLCIDDGKEMHEIASQDDWSSVQPGTTIVMSTVLVEECLRRTEYQCPVCKIWNNVEESARRSSINCLGCGRRFQVTGSEDDQEPKLGGKQASNDNTPDGTDEPLDLIQNIHLKQYPSVCNYF